MARIIAIANHKGGVGKTTTVAAIGAALAAKGLNTLLVDLDSQANLTSSLFKGEPEETIYTALKGKSSVPTIKIRDGLSLTPSTLDMAGVELELSSTIQREFILKDLLEPIQDRYDYILLDCPPSLGLIVVNALVAADEVMIPLTAEALPFKGLVKLTDIITMVGKRLNPSLRLSGIIITRWERGRLSQNVEAALRRHYGGLVFNTKIRKNVSVAEAPLSGKDLLSYAPNSNGAADYKTLTEEITENSNTNNMGNTDNMGNMSNNKHTKNTLTDFESDGEEGLK